MRYGVFIHDPDGDIGYGVILSSSKPEIADRIAERIRKGAEAEAYDVECIVVPLLPGNTSIQKVLDRVFCDD